MRLRRFFGFLLLPMLIVGTTFAEKPNTPLTPEEKTHILMLATEVVMDSLRAHIEDGTLTDAAAAELESVHLKLGARHDQLNQSGDWVFLYTQFYASDAFFKQDAFQAFGPNVAILFRREGTAWTIVDQAVIFSDVIFEGWDKEHQAPPGIFQFQANE